MVLIAINGGSCVMKIMKQSEDVDGRWIGVWLVAAAVVLCAPVTSRAINSVAPAAHTNPGTGYSPGVADIVMLVDAKVDPEVIRPYIKSSPTAYNPSATEIIALKARGVSSDVLTAMLQRGGELRAQASKAGQMGAAPQVQPPYPAAATAYAPAPAYDYSAQPDYSALRVWLPRVFLQLPGILLLLSWVFVRLSRMRLRLPGLLWLRGYCGFGYPGYCGYGGYCGFGYPGYCGFGYGGYYGHGYPGYWGGRGFGYYGNGGFYGGGSYGYGGRSAGFAGRTGGFRSFGATGRSFGFGGRAGSFGARSASFGGRGGGFGGRMGGFGGHAGGFGGRGGGGGGHGRGR